MCKVHSVLLLNTVYVTQYSILRLTGILSKIFCLLHIHNHTTVFKPGNRLENNEGICEHFIRIFVSYYKVLHVFLINLNNSHTKQIHNFFGNVQYFTTLWWWYIYTGIELVTDRLPFHCTVGCTVSQKACTFLNWVT